MPWREIEMQVSHIITSGASHPGTGTREKLDCLRGESDPIQLKRVKEKDIITSLTNTHKEQTESCLCTWIKAKLKQKYTQPRSGFWAVTGDAQI